jgi:hypothetical protein
MTTTTTVDAARVDLLLNELRLRASSVPPSELNPVLVVHSINDNQRDGITIQIGHPTGSGINPKFYVACSIQ